MAANITIQCSQWYQTLRSLRYRIDGGGSGSSILHTRVQHEVKAQNRLKMTEGRSSMSARDSAFSVLGIAIQDGLFVRNPTPQIPQSHPADSLYL